MPFMFVTTHNVHGSLSVMNNDAQFRDLLSLSSTEIFVHLSSISRLKGQCEKLASRITTGKCTAPGAWTAKLWFAKKNLAHHHYREADSQSEHSAPFSVTYLALHIQHICGRRLLSQGQNRATTFEWSCVNSFTNINKQPWADVALQTVSKAWSPIVLSTTSGAMNTWYAER